VSPNRHVLFDTGPLLCFAATDRGPALLRQRFAGWSGIVTDIERELRGLCNHRDAPIADAARTAVDNLAWLEVHVIDDPDELIRIEQRRVELRAFKRRPDTAAHGRDDWGECATLVVAERLRAAGSVVVVANDDAARSLAQRLTIPTASAVDILRALVKNENISSAIAYGMYRDMVAVTDAGDVIRSEAEFRV
jgi:hypothetical protein